MLLYLNVFFRILLNLRDGVLMVKNNFSDVLVNSIDDV